MKWHRTPDGSYASDRNYLIQKGTSAWGSPRWELWPPAAGKPILARTLRDLKQAAETHCRDEDGREDRRRRQKTTGIIRRCRLLDSRTFPGWDVCSWFEWAAAQVRVDLETERAYIKANDYDYDPDDIAEFFEEYPAAFDEMMDWRSVEGERFQVVPMDTGKFAEHVVARMMEKPDLWRFICEIATDQDFDLSVPADMEATAA